MPWKLIFCVRIRSRCRLCTINSGDLHIFSLQGEPVRDVTFPVHPVSQVTAVAWHPERTILACSWESGEVRIWNGTDKEFTNLNGPHTAPVNFLAFSEKGGRLVSADAVSKHRIFYVMNMPCFEVKFKSKRIISNWFRSH